VEEDAYCDQHVPWKEEGAYRYEQLPWRKEDAYHDEHVSWQEVAYHITFTVEGGGYLP
jgi:hypothetical protein